MALAQLPLGVRAPSPDEPVSIDCSPEAATNAEVYEIKLGDELRDGIDTEGPRAPEVKGSGLSQSSRVVATSDLSDPRQALYLGGGVPVVDVLLIRAAEGLGEHAHAELAEGVVAKGIDLALLREHQGVKDACLYGLGVAHSVKEGREHFSLCPLSAKAKLPEVVEATDHDLSSTREEDGVFASARDVSNLHILHCELRNHLRCRVADVKSAQLTELTLPPCVASPIFGHSRRVVPSARRL